MYMYIYIYIDIYVYVYIYIYIYRHRPHMDLPKGPLRDIYIIMLRYVNIHTCQELRKYHGKWMICILEFDQQDM